MAEKRKLLAEIEKVFRKVEEGVDLFEEIMSKMGEASSDNQRDKLQDDLKKEIKKLQRLRDQIKGWQNSNEIKDKESLIKFRKLIEQRMEQFKDIERENKTKPHSKQGLLIEDKIDPKTREKAEALEYLSSCVHKLGEQIDVYECEIESIKSAASKKSKKGDKDDAKVADLRRRLERHKFHTQKLEILMRFVNNETIDSEKITEDFKDTLDHYLEDYLSEELPDADWLYEDLNLGDLAEIGRGHRHLTSENDSAQQLGNVTNIGTLEEAENAEGDAASGISAAAEGSPKPDAETSDVCEVGTPPAAKIKARHTSGEPTPLITAASTRQSLSNMRSTPVTPLKLTAQPSLDSALSGGGSSSIHRPVTPVQQTLAYNSVAAAGLTQMRKPPVVGQHSPGITAAQQPLPLTNYAGAAKEPSIEQRLPPTLTDNVTTALNNMSALAKAVESLSVTQQISVNTAKTSTSLSTHVSPRLVDTRTAASAESTPPTPGLARAPSPAAIELSSSAAYALISATTSGSTVRAHTCYTHVVQTVRDAGPQSAHIPPALGASPLGRVLISDEQDNQLKTLDTAMQHMPMSMDGERLRTYLPYTPCHTPGYYPQRDPLQQQGAAPHADTFEYFAHLAPDTLFFIFYYLEGTKAQYLAAKALKSKSWRFHKKYLMWFQRYEEPKEINDDYEHGSYMYFDFERWTQKKKDGFTFEYRYLEDRELP